MRRREARPARLVFDDGLLDAQLLRTVGAAPYGGAARPAASSDAPSANAEADDISASAPMLAEALRCPHVFHTFTTAEGAGDHCEAGARTPFHARAFAW